VQNKVDINSEYLTEKRRELIEKECYGLLDFIESKRTLDDVAGHVEAKKWLRDDAKLLKKNRLRSIPMGYLLCGRIGTGKTYLTTCWAGEVGIPCVVLKNFRDKWQGSTEGNLEKIFNILRALGQVLVFVDEADQATGRRDSGGSDSGLSGRVYAMLAKEMSDTDNRGRIVWVFATSRPDLVEVDLKRQGRLDVHIPLFPPQTDDERMQLFKATARKLGVPTRSLPLPPSKMNVGGNEMEAMLVRAGRFYDLQSAKTKKTYGALLKDVIADFRPMAHTAHLEYMDLVAVKECTDTKFLPKQYRDMSLEELNARIDVLRAQIGY
jgi:SpoVK/Ycf46/Vps4 family AAA+-type ATPase